MNEPFVSVVIPTFGRASKIAECLDAVAMQQFSRRRYEVLVVDDGSPSPPEPQVDAVRSRMDVRLLQQDHAGAAAARNHGAYRARGNLLVFTDDDCQPSPSWLRSLVSRVAEAPGCSVGGATVNALPHNPYSTTTQMLVDCLLDYYNPDPDAAKFVTSSNLAVPTVPFYEIGGFDTGFCGAAAEDREFCDRWTHHGHRVVYAPEAVVHHSHDVGFGGFFGQHFRYGRGAWRFHQARAGRGDGRVRFEAAAFYGRLLRYPWTRSEGRLRGARHAALMTVAQMANALGFVWEGVRRRGVRATLWDGGRAIVRRRSPIGPGAPTFTDRATSSSGDSKPLAS